VSVKGAVVVVEGCGLLPTVVVFGLRVVASCSCCGIDVADLLKVVTIS
jgi:hypothetical protein